MSKKKIYNKHLEKGRFYIHSDKYGGHPALLYKKRDNKNKYFLVIFTSSDGPKRKKLKHSIEPAKIKESYVHNTPTIGKRRDLGSKPLAGIAVHKDDKDLVKSIKRKKWLIDRIFRHFVYESLFQWFTRLFPISTCESLADIKTNSNIDVKKWFHNKRFY